MSHVTGIRDDNIHFMEQLGYGASGGALETEDDSKKTQVVGARLDIVFNNNLKITLQDAPGFRV